MSSGRAVNRNGDYDWSTRCSLYSTNSVLVFALVDQLRSGEHTTYQKGGGAKLTHAHESEQFASLLNRIELKNAAEDKW
jgi:hypothetical protein